ncbi:MAG: hypothetical protein ACRDOK_23945 [Streptosporangiaceae bacterium]
MTSPAAGAGFLAEPGAVIAGIVRAAEPALGQDDIAAAITRAAPSRSQQRRLAAALSEDPGLLTSGRPEGPPQVELLISAMQERGARRLVLPRCARCGQPKRLVQRDGSLRICSDCDIRRRGAAQPCAICGDTRKVASRDQDGRPRCGRCRPWDDPDPASRIAAHVSRLDPGLDQLRLGQVIREAIAWPFQRHQVLWELDQRPGLLTGDGAHGSPRAVALIQALQAAGVSGVVAPACPACGRTVLVSHRLGAARCCRRCYDQARLDACSRCQQRAPVASRTGAGEPVCANCFRRDPANHERCAGCGRTALAIRGEDGSMRCRRCYRPPLATCSLCGREKPCYLASSGTPRCEHCSRKMHRVPCARCGNVRAVWARTAGGQPLCGSCSRQRVPCTGCGSVRAVAARIPAGPLCSTCYRKHPSSFRPCTECGATGRLYHHGLCTRCACRQHLLSLLSHDQDGLHPHAEAIYHVLAASDPAALMNWLTSGSAARTILAEISQASGPPGHGTLDRYLPSRAARHLRKILVAGGILPARDERLAELERWTGQKTRQIGDPAERRIVASFASWHHLRRLRRDSGRHHITAEQTDYVQNEIRAATRLITWLRDHGTSLGACTQRDIDTWLASGTGSCYHARAFVTWATTRGHARGLDIPNRARRDLLTQIEDDHRWALVRTLLHDDSHAIQDRVAGLLVLLYGQPLARIARLSRDQITFTPDRAQLALGTTPLDLPAPLDELARQLLARRHAHAAVGRTDNHPWLFPGGAPAQPISASRLRVRLAALGIHGRSGRNTALMDLAAKIPPAALARLLGIHINTAGAWADRASGSQAAYAARVSRRAFSKF